MSETFLVRRLVLHFVMIEIVVFPVLGSFARPCAVVFIKDIHSHVGHNSDLLFQSSRARESRHHGDYASLRHMSHRKKIDANFEEQAPIMEPMEDEGSIQSRESYYDNKYSPKHISTHVHKKNLKNKENLPNMLQIEKKLDGLRTGIARLLKQKKKFERQKNNFHKKKHLERHITSKINTYKKHPFLQHLLEISKPHPFMDSFYQKSHDQQTSSHSGEMPPATTFGKMFASEHSYKKPGFRKAYKQRSRESIAHPKRAVKSLPRLGLRKYRAALKNFNSKYASDDESNFLSNIPMLKQAKFTSNQSAHSVDYLDLEQTARSNSTDLKQHTVFEKANVPKNATSPMAPSNLLAYFSERETQSNSVMDSNETPASHLRIMDAIDHTVQPAQYEPDLITDKSYNELASHLISTEPNELSTTTFQLDSSLGQLQREFSSFRSFTESEEEFRETSTHARQDGLSSQALALQPYTTTTESKRQHISRVIKAHKTFPVSRKVTEVTKTSNSKSSLTKILQHKVQKSKEKPELVAKLASKDRNVEIKNPNTTISRNLSEPLNQNIENEENKSAEHNEFEIERNRDLFVGLSRLVTRTRRDFSNNTAQNHMELPPSEMNDKEAKRRRLPIFALISRSSEFDFTEEDYGKWNANVNTTGESPLEIGSSSYASILNVFKNQRERLKRLILKIIPICPDLHGLKLLKAWVTNFRNARSNFTLMEDLSLKYAEDIRLQLLVCLKKIIHGKVGHNDESSPQAQTNYGESEPKVENQLRAKESFEDFFVRKIITPTVTIFSNMAEFVQRR